MWTNSSGLSEGKSGQEHLSTQTTLVFINRPRFDQLYMWLLLEQSKAGHATRLITSLHSHGMELSQKRNRMFPVAPSIIEVCQDKGKQGHLYEADNSMICVEFRWILVG